MLQPQALGGRHFAGSPCLELRVGVGPGGQAGVASGAGRERGAEPCVSGSWAFSPGVCPLARAEENAQMVRAAASSEGRVVTVWHVPRGTRSVLGAGDTAVDRGVLTVLEGRQITGRKRHR